MSGHDDFAFEPQPGLPKKLPEGEVILWQGKPGWKVLIQRVFRLPWIVFYFGVLLVWQAGSLLLQGAPAQAVLQAALWPLGLALAVCSILGGIAWAMQKATIFTLTSERVIIRSGVALPVTINIPFGLIEAARLKLNADGSGDIAFKIVKGQRIYYTLLWPNVRPWRLTRPEPALRGLKNAKPVAEMLAARLATASFEEVAESQAPGDTAELGGPRAAVG
ncbi:photosynthetic complex putative assembly protein PuhB [Limibacillus halophilus]|jgi:hypothetical protein